MRLVPFLVLAIIHLTIGCKEDRLSSDMQRFTPDVVTDTVPNDSDDPAIWYNAADPSASLILGTDKDSMGGIYVFDLEGKILPQLSVTGIQRPNNIDVAYGFKLGDTLVDIAACTERYTESIRIFSLPDMTALDGGGIPVFEGQEPADFRAPMGIALYHSPTSDEIHAIVSRKDGPKDSTYLWQYKLETQGDSVVVANLVRKFGAFTGLEIEALAVDDELGFVYYSDETAGIRKYYADPAKGNAELAFFGTQDFKEDMEGIAIMDEANGTGRIIISDQQEYAFNVYPREGSASDPHDHKLSEKWYLSTIETDGCAASTMDFGPKFPNGIFVAMSEGRVFHIYDLRRLVGMRESN